MKTLYATTVVYVSTSEIREAKPPVGCTAADYLETTVQDNAEAINLLMETLLFYKADPEFEVSFDSSPDVTPDDAGPYTVFMRVELKVHDDFKLPQQPLDLMRAVVNSVLNHNELEWAFEGDGSVLVTDDREFMRFWGTGYGAMSKDETPRPDTVSIAAITEDEGYDMAAQAAINELQVGEGWTDYTHGPHTVVRVK